MSAGTEETPPLPRVGSSAEVQAKAAVEIQRHYRGHRERRQLKGHGLTPNQRWNEALKEAHYRQVARPVSREKKHLACIEENDGRPSANGARRVSESREKWERAVLFARQAQHDDEPSSSSSSDEDSGDEEARKERREEKRAKRQQTRKERIEYSKAMDMQYFLEMVDLKHRYGSNLRAYHSYWQSQPTLENFFYWLDHGAGRTVDLSVCPRTQLDNERVRYLSREERQSYLVKIDEEGRLCWAKNGERIDTTEKYHDSPAGIVPVETEHATAAGSIPHVQHAHHGARRKSNAASRPSSSSSSSSFASSASSESGQSEIAERYVDPEMRDHHGPKKVFHVSASTVLNRLLRKTTKKNTWIFVADNSFRLYVGIKQSGAFQHSSFLHGARVSAAGLIKIKNGRLRSLSPLSGHYRPPANNFRKFVKSLKEANVDMSRVSISKSYAILVGLEAYGNFCKGKGKAESAAKGTAEKFAGKVLPSGTFHSTHKKKDKEEEHAKEQYQLDKPTHYSADGAADNAQVGQPDKALKKKVSIEEKKRDENGFALRFMKKLNLKPRVPKTAAEVKTKGKTKKQGAE